MQGVYLKLSNIITPNGNRTVILGDSIAIGDTNPTLPAWGDSWFAQAAWQSNGRMLLAGNYGVSGNTVGQMLVRVSSVTTASPKPDVCIVMGGTNDARSAIPFADTIGGLKEIYQQLLNSGIYVIACLCPPNSENAAYSRAISLINAWVTGYCSREGIPVFDAYTPLIDSSTGQYNASYTTDNLHPNIAGEFVLGQQFNVSGGPIEMFPRTPGMLLMQGILDAPAATTAYTALNICPNGLMLSPVGGIAGSWGQTGGGAGFTPTNTTTSGINGNVQVITATANAGFIGTTINQAAGTFSVGDRLAVACKMKLTNTSAFQWNIKLAITGGGDSPFLCGASANITMPSNSTAFMPYLEMVVPASTTAISPQVTYISGSGVITYGQFTVINLTKLKLV